jgi:hypothetical protein
MPKKINDESPKIQTPPLPLKWYLVEGMPIQATTSKEAVKKYKELKK